MAFQMVFSIPQGDPTLAEFVLVQRVILFCVEQFYALPQLTVTL